MIYFLLAELLVHFFNGSQINEAYQSNVSANNCCQVIKSVMQSLTFGSVQARREVVFECYRSQCSVAVFEFVFQALVSWLAIWCRALSHTIPLTGADRERQKNRYSM